MNKETGVPMSDEQAVRQVYPDTVITEYPLTKIGRWIAWECADPFSKVLGRGETRAAALADARYKLLPAPESARYCIACGVLDSSHPTDECKEAITEIKPKRVVITEVVRNNLAILENETNVSWADARAKLPTPIPTPASELIDRECVICGYQWYENHSGTNCPACADDETNHPTPPSTEESGEPCKHRWQSEGPEEAVTCGLCKTPYSQQIAELSETQKWQAVMLGDANIQEESGEPKPCDHSRCPHPTTSVCCLCGDFKPGFHREHVATPSTEESGEPNWTGLEGKMRLAEQKVDQFLQGQGPDTVRLGVALQALREALLMIETKRATHASESADYLRGKLDGSEQ